MNKDSGSDIKPATPKRENRICFHGKHSWPDTISATPDHENNEKDLHCKNRFLRQISLYSLHFAILTVIFLSAFSIPASSTPAIPDPILTATLPEKTDLFFQCTSLDTLYDYLSITPETIWGEPIVSKEEIQAKLGFNPFDLAALRANGVDVSRPMGIAMIDFMMVDEENPSFNLLFFLPAKDEQKAMAWIQRAIEQESEGVQFQSDGTIRQWIYGMPDLSSNASDNSFASPESEVSSNESNKEDAEPSSDEEMGFADDPISFPNYMAAANGYVLMGTNPSEAMGDLFKTIFNRLVKRGGDLPGLADNATFKKVAGNLGKTKDLLFYADLKKLISNNPDTMTFLSHFSPGFDSFEDPEEAANDATNKEYSVSHPSLALLKEYSAFGGSVDLKNPDFTADFYLDLVKNSKMLSLFKGVPVHREIVLGLQEHPVLLWGAAQNMQTYWQLIQETLDQTMKQEMNEAFAQIKADYGFDVEKDLIANLGNNVNVGLFDGMSINMGNINALVSIEFKDPSKMRSLIEKVIKALPEEQQMMVNRIEMGGNSVYMLPVGPFQLYAGFKGNALILTMGKPMFEKALASDPSKGFMTSIKDHGLKSRLNGDLSMSYLNFKELYLVVKNFLPMVMSVSPDAAMVMTPEFQKLVAQFDHIVMGFNPETDGFKGSFVIKTHFDKPFLKGVKSISDQIMAMKETNSN